VRTPILMYPSRIAGERHLRSLFLETHGLRISRFSNHQDDHVRMRKDWMTRVSRDCHFCSQLTRPHRQAIDCPPAKIASALTSHRTTPSIHQPKFEICYRRITINPFLHDRKLRPGCLHQMIGSQLPGVPLSFVHLLIARDGSAPST
jgi:hypothetical protein